MRDDGTTRRRYLLTVGVLGTAGLAGCASDGGDGGTTPDRTGTAGGTTPGSTAEAAQTTATDPATTAEPLDPPAGTGPDGISDPDALVEATSAALAGDDYDVAQRHTSTGENGIDVRQHTRSSLDDRRQLFVFDATTETNRVYTEGDTRYAKTQQDGETSYGSGAARQSFEELHRPEMLGGGESLGGILEFGSYAPAGTVTRLDRRLARFELQSASLDGDATVTEATGQIAVSGESVVFGGALSLTAERDGGQTLTLEKRFEIRALGDVTVERPSWFDRAAATTTGG